MLVAPSTLRPVSKFATAAKRLLVGRPFRSDRLSHTLLPKRIALPVFASDALSSVAYAPEEIFLVLSIAGISGYVFAPWIGVAVAVVMMTVVFSYRQNVHAYPSGGGDYEIANANLGRYGGLTVGSALLVDYILTVAVSISSAMANIGSLIPYVAEHKVIFAVVAIVLLTAVNLRGIRESGSAFAIPTYAFMIGMILMILFGLFRGFVLDESMPAESAGFTLNAENDQLMGLALAMIVLRSFTQGCAALTGVEAISNGVPAFRKPKSRNAATTLLMMGLIAVIMLMGLVVLAQLTGVKIAEHPDTQLGGAPADYHQKTMVVQIANAVFNGFPVGAVFIAAVTALILVLAANTAFNGFPVLGSILAQDRYLPRQLHTRGDRLAFSNGIVFLAGFAILLVILYEAEVGRLIPLYTVGVFVSFTLSQAGMVRHWNKLLRGEQDIAVLTRLKRSRLISGFGMIMTGVVLIVVLITKFTLGAWVAIAAMAAVFALMTGIRKHYDHVAQELEAAEADRSHTLPARNHAVVLVSKLHMPTLRAISYARATRPDVLEAVTVNVDDTDTRRLVTEWERQDIPVPLKVVESPYREITKPVLDYVKRIRTSNPRDVVTVFIPEYVVGRWWEHVLHNQSALRLKGRLLFQPGVMVVSVPWQLVSSERRVAEAPVVAPGAIRRGFDPIHAAQKAAEDRRKKAASKAAAKKESSKP
ncbi:APC family permease [Crossiella cryophila]